MPRLDSTGETGILRRYFVSSDVEESLDGSRLRLGALVCEPDGSIYPDQERYLNDPLSFEWAPDEQSWHDKRRQLARGLADTGLEPNDVVYTITARSGYLKNLCLLDEGSLGDLESLPRSVHLHEGSGSPDALMAPVHGSEVALTLSLAANRPNKPQRQPHEKGYRLARAHFRLETSRKQLLFDFRPLRPQTKSDKGLDADVFTYLEFQNKRDIMTSLEDHQYPILWIDSDVYNVISLAGETRHSQAIQNAIVVSAIRESVFRYAAEIGSEDQHPTPSELDNLVKETLIGAIVTTIAGNNASSDRKRELMEEARQFPYHFAAKADGIFSLKDSALAALRDDPTSRT